ncbi:MULTISPECIES: helix-turn-helix transcriptional regulator [Paraburkholderia]|uniref:helix-turn-helix transcriptional regulator n=1 Tax=Paraburkholderia TaxID=1822464 RepID=UPI0038B8AB86
MIDRIVRVDEVAAILGISKPTVIRWVERGVLQKPIKIGPRAVGWRESDIEAYIASREEVGAEALA